MLPVVHIPTQELYAPLFERYAIRMLVKRIDLVHPFISGNKWFKLKYNLQLAQQQGAKCLLSFGGAFSNHIYALAAAGAEYGFQTIGVIRGEPYEPSNPTLQFAQQQGMQLFYLTREQYRRKMSPEILDMLKQHFGDFYLLPEGGTNSLAVRGCSEILDDVQEPFDVVACACGTGGTLAGLIVACQGKQQLLGVAALKGADFLYQDIAQLLPQEYSNWQLELEAHHGGYAKTTAELWAFMQSFELQHQIKLDPIYTGKLFFALYRKIEQQQFARGTTILAIHSGGLQGCAGFSDKESQ